MCLGIPGCVVEFADESHHLAKVDVGGVRRTVNVALVLPDGLQPGDWVLIHVGFALSKIDEAEARRTTEFLQQLGDPWEQEVQQLSESEIE
jgi:hydrogenase expression/formation protein HypC